MAKKKVGLGSRGEHLWYKVPGFVEWLKQNAPALTNIELAAALKERYQVDLNRLAIESLRRSYGLTQTAETRKRAIRSRSMGFEATPDDRTNAQLREANRNLMRRMEEQRITKSELVKAVHDAAAEAATALEIKPVPKQPRTASKNGTPEVAVIQFTDWQLAKRTATYTTEVCEERVERYVDKVIRLVNLQRADHPVTSARVYLTGDLIEGEMIFPGQAHRIDASLYRQVMVDGPRILGNAVRRLASHFDTLHVDGVIGNHGAIGGVSRREYHPESNADAMMYETTRLVLDREPNITWSPNIRAGERKWYSVDYIGKKGFLLFHGDQVKGGFAGFPWYGFAKKVQGWAMGAIPEKFHYALAGHFHTPTRMLVGRVTLWVGGSTESDNTYAAEMLAAQGTPSQWLLFAHPEHGVTAEYQVHLERGAYE